MKRVSAGDPQRIVYRSGGGVLTLVGIPFICIGAFVLALGFSGKVDAGGRLPVVLVGLLHAAAGVVIALSRSGLEIDLGARTWRSWWGLIVPLRSREGSLDDVKNVSIDLEWRRTKHGSFKVFPVRLQGAPRKIGIGAPRSYDQARREAEDLARALQLPLVDSTSGEAVSRRPEEIDESLRDRARREGKPPVSLADPPAGMRSRFEVDGHTVRFVIPPPGSGRRLWGILPFVIFECIVLALLIPKLLDAGGRPEKWAPIVIFGGAVLLIPLVAIVAMLTAGARRECTVEASADSIRLETRGPFGRTISTAIPSGEVEDLTVGDAIIVRSDARTISFGAHLSREEKAWIRGVLEQVLTA